MPELIKKKNTLLNSLRDGTTTRQEFIKSCVVWLMEPRLWRDIYVKHDPTPPQCREWDDYVHMSKTEKAKVNERFYDIPEIATYFKAKDYVNSLNIGMYGWLKEQKSEIPDIAENLEIHRKLDAKIYEFRNWIRRFAPKYVSSEPQEDDGRSYNPSPASEFVGSVVDKFDGRIVNQ